jgi:hypothetical protein
MQAHAHEAALGAVLLLVVVAYITKRFRAPARFSSAVRFQAVHQREAII